MKPSVPIYLFSGFLGSGKTTLLKHVLDYFSKFGKKAAVIMNEIGEVNVDGQEVETGVPMTELLSGCICCSVNEDLGTTIHNVCREYEPDVIIIESTGVANPVEIISAVTEVSLQLEVDLCLIVTVIDAPHLLELCKSNKGKTYQLMKEQIRCGNRLLLNKADKITTEEMRELKKMICKWNPYASIQETVYCQIDLDFIDTLMEPRYHRDMTRKNEDEKSSLVARFQHAHDHVKVYTHYFDHPIIRKQFEELIEKLPKDVYRAKGILWFTDKKGPMLFQYTHQQLEFLRITPKEEMPNVAVFIGENFSKEEVISEIKKLNINHKHNDLHN